MIRNTFNTDFGNVAGLLASDTPLTTAEVTALHDEIASDPAARGYAGQTASQVLSLGAAGYFTANPASAGRVLPVSCELVDKQADKWDCSRLAEAAFIAGGMRDAPNRIPVSPNDLWIELRKEN